MGRASTSVVTGQLSNRAPGSRRIPTLRDARAITVPGRSGASSQSSPATFLILLAAAAGTGIIASHLGRGDWFGFFFLIGFIGKEDRLYSVEHQALVERNLHQHLFISSESTGHVLDLIQQRMCPAAGGLAWNR